MYVLSAIAGKVAQKMIKNILRLDPQSQDLIADLGCNSMTIALSDFPFAVTLLPVDGRLDVQINGDSKADVIIKGGISDLVALATTSHPQAVLSERQITVNGNLHVLMSYQKLVHKLNLDWEYWLSPLIGKMAAHEVCTKAASIKNWAAASARSTKMDLVEYLQEESGLLPPREEVADFYEDIVALQTRIDRMQAKIWEAS